MLEQNLNLVAFLQKTYQILNTPKYINIIAWDLNGKFITILDSLAFQTEVLPFYFKHKNMKSFVRQLNLYGFRKVKKFIYKNSFFHPHFQRDDKTNVLNIRRRKGLKNIPLNSAIKQNPFMSPKQDTASNISTDKSIQKKESPVFIDKNVKQNQNNQLDLHLYQQNPQIWDEEPFPMPDILESNIFLYIQNQKSDNL